jgi:hypothetical protein
MEAGALKYGIFFALYAIIAYNYIKVLYLLEQFITYVDE